MLATTAAALVLAMSGPLPKLSVHGMDMVDPHGNRVVLKGCNLGNWLIMEGWMLSMWDDKYGFSDQYTFEKVLADRFGGQEKDRLMELYRSSWITERDFPIIKSFGFNVVRLPLNYRLFEDDAKPFHLKPNAFKWVDKAVEMAERNGIYTILDMHGVQGGQSTYDHTGHSGQNKLWSDPTNVERLAWLWGQVAARYKNRNSVLAYDVFNEPYGGSKPDQVRVFKAALAGIRKSDPEKLVFAHGNSDDFSHYGDPKSNGWHNVGFEMHYYPGLFGNGDMTVLTNAKHLARLQRVAKQTKRLNVPFLIGEMNVVGKSGGGAAMMRRTFDAHASFGWMTTMWSYKVETEDGKFDGGSWGMVSGQGGTHPVAFRTASLEEIEKWMKGFATEPYTVYEELRQVMTAKNPTLPAIPVVPKPLFSVTSHDTMPGWTVTDLGGALKGGLAVRSDDFTLYGGGDDLWGKSDQCRFLQREVSGDFELQVTVNSVADVHSYSKAGLMVRDSLDASSPAYVLSVFPSGGVEFAARSHQGEDMKGLGTNTLSLPVQMRLVRKNGVLTAWVADQPGQWHKVESTPCPSDKVYVGCVSLSHDNEQLLTATYTKLVLQKP